MFPTFDTDEQEFDRIQKGQPFEVRYLEVPIGLLFLGVVPAHLARETVDLHIASVLARFTPNAWIVAYVLVLAFLILIVTKSTWCIPGARWALFAMIGIGAIYILTPTLPVTLSGPTQQATATVKELHTFTKIIRSRSRSRGIDASTPYELVVLQYVPAGRRDPVIAGDMIDIASQKDLAVGQQVAIDYETAHPRHANIRGATRAYYRENVQGAILSGFATIALLVGATLAWEAVKRRGKKAMEEARERARDRAL